MSIVLSSAALLVLTLACSPTLAATPSDDALAATGATVKRNDAAAFKLLLDGGDLFMGGLRAGKQFVEESPDRWAVDAVIKRACVGDLMADRFVLGMMDGISANVAARLATCDDPLIARKAR